MKAAIYVRVSTELEVQASSLVAQEDLLIKYIVDRGWILLKVYSDSLNATKGNRSGFNQMVRDAKDKKFDIILAKEQFRLARNIGTSADFRKIVMSNDIHIITLDDAIDTLKGDVSKYGLYAWIYEDESRRTSNRIKTSSRTSAEKGRYLKGEAPYAYNASEGKLYPDKCDFIIVGKESFYIFSCDINLVLKNPLLLNNMNKTPKKSTKNKRVLNKKV